MSRRVTSTTFKKGMIPWNKKEKVTLICQFCQKEFIVPFGQKNAKYCSRKCANDGWSIKKIGHSKQLKCVELAKENKTIREISIITGYPPGSVSSYLNKAKYRKRTQLGQSYASQVKRLKRLYKTCKICQFDRCIEIAHIIPARKGGDLTVENTLALCPNHHHLFDNNKLLFCEAIKLKDKINKWDIYASNK